MSVVVQPISDNIPDQLEKDDDDSSYGSWKSFHSSSSHLSNMAIIIIDDIGHESPWREKKWQSAGQKEERGRLKKTSSSNTSSTDIMTTSFSTGNPQDDLPSGKDDQDIGICMHNSDGNPSGLIVQLDEDNDNASGKNDLKKTKKKKKTKGKSKGKSSKSSSKKSKDHQASTLFVSSVPLPSKLCADNDIEKGHKKAHKKRRNRGRARSDPCPKVSSSMSKNELPPAKSTIQNASTKSTSSHLSPLYPELPSKNHKSLSDVKTPDKTFTTKKSSSSSRRRRQRQKSAPESKSMSSENRKSLSGMKTTDKTSTTKKSSSSSLRRRRQPQESAPDLKSLSSENHKSLSGMKTTDKKTTTKKSSSSSRRLQRQKSAPELKSSSSSSKNPKSSSDTKKTNAKKSSSSSRRLRQRQKSVKSLGLDTCELKSKAKSFLSLLSKDEQKHLQNSSHSEIQSYFDNMNRSLPLILPSTSGTTTTPKEQEGSSSGSRTNSSDNKRIGERGRSRHRSHVAHEDRLKESSERMLMRESSSNCLDEERAALCGNCSNSTKSLSEGSSSGSRTNSSDNKRSGERGRSRHRSHVAHEDRVKESSEMMLMRESSSNRLYEERAVLRGNRSNSTKSLPSFKTVTFGETTLMTPRSKSTGEIALL